MSWWLILLIVVGSLPAVAVAGIVLVLVGMAVGVLIVGPWVALAWALRDAFRGDGFRPVKRLGDWTELLDDAIFFRII